MHDVCRAQKRKHPYTLSDLCKSVASHAKGPIFDGLYKVGRWVGGWREEELQAGVGWFV